MSGTCKNCKKGQQVKAARSTSPVLQNAWSRQAAVRDESLVNGENGQGSEGERSINGTLNICNGYAVPGGDLEEEEKVENGVTSSVEGDRVAGNVFENGFEFSENESTGIESLSTRGGDYENVVLVNGFHSTDMEESESLFNGCQAGNENVMNRASCAERFVSKEEKAKIKENKINNSDREPAARPKTISWSRTVKQRKEMKEKTIRTERRKHTRRNIKSQGLLSSSDDSSDETGNIAGSKKNGTSLSSLSSAGTSGTSMESSDYINRFSENYMEEGFTNILTSSNIMESNRVSNTVNRGDNNCPYDFRLHDSNIVSAPLALPEDSDGSSVTNGSDLRMENEQISGSIYTSNSNPVVNNAPVLASQAENLCRIIAVDHVYVEDHLELPMRGDFVNVVDPLPSITRRSSADSLEEVGDFIETDFPSRACRHMFQSSSRSSSPSTDSDEGYVVNAERRLPGDLDVEGASYLPTTNSNPNNPSCQHNSLSCDTHSKMSSCECYNVHVPTSADNPKVLCGDRAEETNCRVEGATKHTNRLDSVTGKSEEGSEGIVGSDSSVMYSPENDFLEFIDSDAPPSASGNQRLFPFNQEYEEDVIASGNFGMQYRSSSVDEVENFPLNYIRGAEGGATNNLNMYEFDEIDHNLELLDPHLLTVENENYLCHDICKHEKVPRANFQNSESNRHEKIYFKRAIEKENRSSDSGSSDNEENLAYCLPREQLLNVGDDVVIERPPQNCDNGDCMVLEDLENLTHALQNAVIMHLPNKLEESSGYVVLKN